MDTEMDLDRPSLDTAHLKPHLEQEVMGLWTTWRTVHEMLVDRVWSLSGGRTRGIDFMAIKSQKKNFLKNLETYLWP